MFADRATAPFPWFGDPTPFGWMLVAAYLLAAWACSWALRIARKGEAMSRDFAGEERRRRARAKAYHASCVFWLGLGMAFIVLGVNKQLDLQIWITERMRDLAVAQGWHAQRRIVQSVVVVLLACAGMIGLAIVLLRTRELMPRHVLAFVGAMLLACFALAQMTSFHNLDAYLYRNVLGTTWYTLIELAGVACVGACAMLNCRWYLWSRLNEAEARLETRHQLSASSSGSAGLIE